MGFLWLNRRVRARTTFDSQRGLFTLQTATSVSCHTSILAGIFWPHIENLENSIWQNGCPEKVEETAWGSRQSGHAGSSHVGCAGTCLCVAVVCFGWAPRWWWLGGWRWPHRRIWPLSPQSPPQAQGATQTPRYLWKVIDHHSLRDV